MADSYTVAEAARLIGRSTKRVRQMIAEGKFTAEPDSQPVRIPAAEVHRVREASRPASVKPGPKSSTELTMDDVMALVDKLTTRAIEANAAQVDAALKMHEQSQQILRDSLAEERAKRLATEALLEQTRQELETVRAVPAPRRFWKR
jgi:excisionase family DNA binding protein